MSRLPAKGATMLGVLDLGIPERSWKRQQQDVPSANLSRTYLLSESQHHWVQSHIGSLTRPLSSDHCLESFTSFVQVVSSLQSPHDRAENLLYEVGSTPCILYSEHCISKPQNDRLFSSTTLTFHSSKALRLFTMIKSNWFSFLSFIYGIITVRDSGLRLSLLTSIACNWTIHPVCLYHCGCFKLSSGADLNDVKDSVFRNSKNSYDYIGNNDKIHYFCILKRITQNCLLNRLEKQLRE